MKALKSGSFISRGITPVRTLPAAIIVAACVQTKIATSSAPDSTSALEIMRERAVATRVWSWEGDSPPRLVALGFWGEEEIE